MYSLWFVFILKVYTALCHILFLALSRTMLVLTSKNGACKIRIVRNPTVSGKLKNKTYKIFPYKPCQSNDQVANVEVCFVYDLFKKCTEANQTGSVYFC